MATLILMVGLPGAGKTTEAHRLAGERPALRLTTDEWMIALFGAANPPDRRDIVEARLIATALDVLGLGLDVVLDFGLWTRDERSALRSLAASRGADCEIAYLAVDPETQRQRIGRRWAETPAVTFAMTDAEQQGWREAFEAPDDAELAGADVGPPPTGSRTWASWASARWPSLDL